MAQALMCGGVVRRLKPSDLVAFRAHLLRLDAESRFARFGEPVTDDFIDRHAEHCFNINDVIYGYFVDGAIRGAGELRATGTGIVGGSVDTVFSVERDWRPLGVGIELMACVVRAERDRRTNVLEMPLAYASRPLH
jgi:hypothetical protein